MCCYTGTKFASPSVYMLTIIMLIVVKFSVDMIMFLGSVLLCCVLLSIIMLFMCYYSESFILVLLYQVCYADCCYAVCHNTDAECHHAHRCLMS